MTLNILLQYLLPQRILSRLIAKIANCRLKLIKNFLISQYCKIYSIDLSEALESDLNNYPSFNTFFARELKKEARPITPEKNIVISPADGTIIQFGKINQHQLICAKNSKFSLQQLVGNEHDAQLFQHGSFAVIYLAPFNYHRVHMPLDGKLQSMRYIPGKLFSVNPKIIDHVPNVFARNERVVSIFDTRNSKMGVVMVGAMIVGGIHTVWANSIMPNDLNKITEWNYEDQNIALNRGDQLGYFMFGSTVILLFPENSMEFLPGLQINQPIKMGQDLARYNFL